MKQRNSVLSLILVCCLCFVLMTGCTWFEKEPDPVEPTTYYITIDQNIENGVIECDRTSAKAGETITVTAKADENYMLAAITVDGVLITGNSFEMPEKDVVISATFDLSADLTEAVSEDAIRIKAQSAGGASATGHINLTFGETGLNFKALVEDASIVDRDGVAILFSQETPVIAGLLKDGKTIKVSVSAKGAVSIQATDADGVLQTATLDGITAKNGSWSKDGKKLDGYFAEIFVPYGVLGVTAETAKGGFTVCPVVYSAYGTLPAQGASLPGMTEDAQNTFAVLTDDNTLRDNKYSMLSAQLGSFGSLGQGEYWDLSKDYYKDDTENYPNREALLTGHDNNDNNVVFYRVSANEMYVRATLTATGVSNKNDQWPKFGLMLFDGMSKKGVYFYVDAVMSGASDNTLNNIVGTDVGYNIGADNGYGSWVTAKNGVFNLDTKSIVMEMVYQDGWVHMYADGQLIKTVYYGSYNENLHFGIKSFGIDLKVTDYLASDDAEADGWADKKQTAPAAETVDILFAGDSYMDFWNGRHIGNQLSYTGATYANIGVGGTKVQYWLDKASELARLYVPAKIAFHISVNDIDDANADPNVVLANLKTMLEKYHEVFPGAKIYWNSLIPNTMFASKYNDYKVINAGVLEFAGENEWLVYIDQTTVFDNNGAARQDVFDDGLHLSVDIGYPLWADTMLTAMGYERPDGTTMGDIDGFSHTGLWEFGTDDNGEYAFSAGNWDTALWFKNVQGENVYVEAIISATKLNNGDGYPKFGLLIRNDHESRWGFIDAVGFNQANTTAGMVYRGLVHNDAGFDFQGSWDWNTTIWGIATGCNFGEVKLAIAKLGNTAYFLVNDVVYTTCEFTGDVVVGFECFNLETTIRNVKATTDVAEIERHLGIRCQDADIDGVADDSIWTEEVLNNTIHFGDKGDGRHFEFAAVKGTDGIYFLVDTYSFENTRSSEKWWENANIEFRFNGVQQFIYVDGAGFGGVRTSGGITLSAIKALENVGDLYHTRFEFFAPYSTFGAGSEDLAEIPVNVFGWVWDGDSFQSIMHEGGAHYGLNLTVSEHGARFERKITVSGTNAGVSVNVPATARKGDTIVAEVNVAEGQTLDFIKVNGVEYEVVDGKISFAMPDADVAIEVALAGIGVTSNIVNNSGENYIDAKVNCETATAIVGETVTFTVDGYDANEVLVAVTVNGEAVLPVEGVYSYVVKANDTAIAIVASIDYNLSEAIDGVKGEGYGNPISFLVAGGRSVTVWARNDDHGVYFYVEAYTNTVVTTGAEWWQNHNFEFYLNHGAQSYVNVNGLSKGTSRSVYSVAQQDNGKYLNIVELYVNEGHISGFNPESVTLNYAFKAPGEAARYEDMINNVWPESDWWRTSHSTPENNHTSFGRYEIPSCIHITKEGIYHDCENTKIDGDLSEYEGKNALLGLGDENAKFDLMGYLAEDGFYLGITIYQNDLSATVSDWWNNDNLEIQLFGDDAGFSIIEGFIAGHGSIADHAIVRTYDENKTNGYAYTTIVELYYAYDCSDLTQVTLQVGANGAGFKGWHGIIWDGNIAYLSANGIVWGTNGGWNQASRDFAALEGTPAIDGVREDFYNDLTSVTYEANGATIVITGKKYDTGILILSTITHTKAPETPINNDGTAWWHMLDLEYRIGKSWNTQIASSVFDNGNYAGLSASKAVSTQNADGTYTTVFETFVTYTSIGEAVGNDYSGDISICVGGWIETGFVWLAGNGSENAFTNLYVTETGFVKK